MQHSSQNTKQIFLTDNGINTIDVGKDEHVVVFDILLDNNVDRNVEVLLNGGGARAEVFGLFFGNKEQEFRSSHVIRHNASNTTSLLVTKGALDDRAKSSYSSLINIKKGSTGCSGDQKEDTLLLSRECHIDAVPALEIANDDVRATHSVSTTYLDEVKRFYLESRGMSEDDAKNTIVMAHFSDILEKIEDHDIKSNIANAIQAKL